MPSYQAADLLWLLRVDFGGSPHYISTEPLTITRDDGTTIAYSGGLTEPAYSESLSRFTYSRDALTLAIEAIFDNLDLAEHRRRGFLLSNATCELAAVFRVAGTIQQTYEERIRVIDGWMSEPVYADPARPPGYVTFSINSNPYDVIGTFFKSTMRLTETSMDALITTGQPLSDESVDKVYPFVFGNPGVFFSATDSATSYTRGTPAYAINRTNISKEAQNVLIAGHHVGATEVRIRAGKLTAVTGLSVTNGFDKFRNPIAYVDVSSQSTAFKEKEEFWVTWYQTPTSSLPTRGLSAKNPFSTSGVVNGAGDLLIWACTLGDFKVDHGAWGAARDYLNAFRFSGYVNDPDTTVWEWIQEIAKMIPTLTIRNGPAGIYPIIQDLRSTTTGATSITAGPDFHRLGPVSLEGDQGDIVNTVVIEFAYNAQGEISQSYVVIGEPDETEPERFSSLHAAASISRYGIREKSIEAPFIYDRSTAALVAEATVQIHGQIPETVEYKAGIAYSYLMLGDQVALTDSELYLTDQICTVCERAWDGDGWVIKLLIEDDPARDPRYS